MTAPPGSGPTRRTVVKSTAWAVPAIAVAAAVPEAAASAAQGPGRPSCAGVVQLDISSLCAPTYTGSTQQHAQFAIKAQNVPHGQLALLTISFSIDGATAGSFTATLQGDVTGAGTTITGVGSAECYLMGHGGAASGTITVVADTVPAGSSGFIQVHNACNSDYASVNIHNSNGTFTCQYTG